MLSRASVLLSCLLAACAGGAGQPVRAAGALSYAGYDATGLASWYGEEAGTHTASGRRFDPASIIAAHRTLPLGTIVEVTALDTGRSALVLVDDRGPYRDDRLIDLSRGAARLLGTDRRSVSKVRVRVVTPTVQDQRMMRAGGAVLTGQGSSEQAIAALDPSRRYMLQVASFASRDRAAALAGRLGADLIPAGALWRVRLGPFDAAAAQRARDDVARRGYADAVLLSTD